MDIIIAILLAKYITAFICVLPIFGFLMLSFTFSDRLLKRDVQQMDNFKATCISCMVFMGYIIHILNDYVK